MTKENKLFWKYVGVLLLIIGMLFILMAGESLIDNYLLPIK